MKNQSSEKDDPADRLCKGCHDVGIAVTQFTYDDHVANIRGTKGGQNMQCNSQHLQGLLIAGIRPIEIEKNSNS